MLRALRSIASAEATSSLSEKRYRRCSASTPQYLVCVYIYIYIYFHMMPRDIIYYIISYYVNTAATLTRL